MSMSVTRAAVFAAVFAVAVLAPAQEAARPAVPETTPRLEIRVRVTGPDGAFLDGLTAADFVLTEDGFEQKIDGLYRVRGRDVLATDSAPPPGPQIAPSHFFVLFQAVDYDPKFGEAMQTLFSSLLPGDTLTLQTPVKSYTLSPKTLAAQPKDTLAKEMSQILRKDVQIGGSDYRSILRDLRRLVKSISGDTSLYDSDLETDATITSASGLEILLDRYRDALQKMESIRLIDEGKFFNFAGAVKGLSGRKVVFLFYQREFRPEISVNVMNQLMSMNQDRQDILGMIQELFQFYKREKKVSQERLSRAFADASLLFHFIFMNKESPYVFGVNMREQSEDVFEAFSAVAAATGGVCETAVNPAASFRKALASSDDFYLLYYTPTNALRDRSFRSVRVAVSRPGAKVAGRLGYYAY